MPLSYISLAHFSRAPHLLLLCPDASALQPLASPSILRRYNDDDESAMRCRCAIDLSIEQTVVSDFEE